MNNRQEMKYVSWVWVKEKKNRTNEPPMIASFAFPNNVPDLSHVLPNIVNTSFSFLLFPSSDQFP